MPVERVAWFTDKTHKQKTKVAAEITDSIVHNTGTDANRPYIPLRLVASTGSKRRQAVFHGRYYCRVLGADDVVDANRKADCDAAGVNIAAWEVRII